MALLGSLDTLRLQLARPDHFAAAFRYLEAAFQPGGEVQRRVRALAVGQTERIELSGGAFALEQAYVTKPRSDGRFEAHEKYVDLQAIVHGEEWIEVFASNRLSVQEDLMAEKDVRFYADVSEASRWRLTAGDVAVFFPIDAHMPSLCGAAPQPVFKTVVKVPVPV